MRCGFKGGFFFRYFKDKSFKVDGWGDRLNKKLRSRGGECNRGRVGGEDETSGCNISVTVEAGYGHILDSVYYDFYFL